jgi:DNA-binding LacI/PurR family transcriptional regulator
MCASRADVAKLAGVAESTVSRALSGSTRISDATRRRVEQAAQELSYVPNRQASLLARRKTFRLGLVIPSYESFPPFSRAYFPALLDGAVMAADRRGYTISIVLDKPGDASVDLAHLVRSKDVDGLLLSILPEHNARIGALIDNSIPFVLINSYCKGCSSADARPEPGMRKAVEYATRMNHKRIAFITGDMSYQNAQDRLACFEELADEFALERTIVRGSFSRTNGYYLAGKLLNNPSPPTLVMTSADRAAIGVLDYCREHNIRVPHDLSVIGFDDLAPAREVTPALTTVENPVTGTASEATDLLISILEKETDGPVEHWLDTDFVVRHSTCKHKGDKDA